MSVDTEPFADGLFSSMLCAMLVFSPLSGGGIRVSGGEKDLVVFPKDPSGHGDDVVLLPAPEENPVKGRISWPGEYDIAKITIRGIGQEEGQQVSYLTEVEGTRCAFLSSPLKEWNDRDLERLGDVHVLVLPAESHKLAQTLIDEIDPRVLMLLPGGDGKLDSEVLKSSGAAGKERVSEYKLKGALPAEGREVVVFG